MPEPPAPQPSEARPATGAEDTDGVAGIDGMARPQPPPSWSERVASLGDALGVDITPVRLLVTLLLLAGITAAGYALLRAPMVAPPEESLPFADPGAAGGSGGAATTASTIPAELVVHAAGAVVSPGIYRMPTGARIADVVTVAGGAASDADLNRVNLAATVEDGQQVYIPRVGEAALAGAGSSTGGAGGAEGGGGPVNVNSADAEELDALPGIGPAIAQAIITYREENGSFETVDELLEVPGIGDAKLAQLRDVVTV
ncbi:MAG: helix-hairpin-helix domain-containing protein [Acidimicrobiales bacterium]